MSRESDRNQSDAAAAIDEVLIAETAAREAMEACRQAAERVLEAAREDARRIGRVANQRVSKLHARCDQRVAAKINALREAAGNLASDAALDTDDLGRLEQAVARLAARMTRPGHG